MVTHSIAAWFSVIGEVNAIKSSLESLATCIRNTPRSVLPSFGSVQVELAIPSRTLKLEKKANENEIKNEMNENYNEINCEFQV